VDLNTVREIASPQDRTRVPDWREGDAYLAGGTWLFSEPQPGLRRLIDLTALEWPALEVSEDGLTIAATCTLAELAGFAPPPRWPAGPLFRQCCDALLGSFKVWNAATVGGNICLSLPAGPMTSMSAALDGVCRIWTADGSERTVPVVDFVTGPSRNVLEPGDLLRAVFLPAAALRSRTAFRQQSLSPVGRSAALVIGRRDDDGAGSVFTVTAATRRPVQLRFDRPPSSEELLGALEDAAPTWHADVHGHPVWREQLTRLMLDEVRRELDDSA
jgi:CO/xanthine dehydrogenase FAD-binding subunit